MGFTVTGVAYCLCGDVALQGITNCVKVVDDILLFDDDLPAHIQHIFQMLTQCCVHGITIDKVKFMATGSQVNFCGYNLSAEGISTYPEKLEAITDFPTPTDLTDMHSFMGLVKQLAELSPDILEPFDPILTVILQTDTSRLYDIGYALLQHHCKDIKLKFNADPSS